MHGQGNPCIRLHSSMTQCPLQTATKHSQSGLCCDWIWLNPPWQDAPEATDWCETTPFSSWVNGEGLETLVGHPHIDFDPSMPHCATQIAPKWAEHRDCLSWVYLGSRWQDVSEAICWLRTKLFSPLMYVQALESLVGHECAGFGLHPSHAIMRPQDSPQMVNIKSRPWLWNWLNSIWQDISEAVNWSETLAYSSWVNCEGPESLVLYQYVWFHYIHTMMRSYDNQKMG